MNKLMNKMLAVETRLPLFMLISMPRPLHLETDSECSVQGISCDCKSKNIQIRTCFLARKIFKWFPSCLTQRVPSPFDKKFFLSLFANSHFNNLLHKEFLLLFFINIVVCLTCQITTLYHARYIIHECFSFFVCDHFRKFMPNEISDMLVK